MKIFKTAFAKFNKFFPGEKYEAKRPAQHPAKAEAAKATIQLRDAAIKRLRSPTQAQRRRWKWFHVSKRPMRVANELKWSKGETYIVAKGPNVKETVYVR